MIPVRCVTASTSFILLFHRDLRNTRKIISSKKTTCRSYFNGSSNDCRLFYKQGHQQLSLPKQKKRMLDTGSMQNNNILFPYLSRSRQKRTLLTKSIEPPPNIPERPCTVILGEDYCNIENFNLITKRISNNNNDNYAVASWEDRFRFTFPTEHGISFAKWSLSSTNSRFDDALMEMKHDFSLSSSIVSNNEIVFIARGPWISWMTQFYLEDFPLAGLVLIDPLPFDQTATAVQLYKNLLGQSNCNDSKTKRKDENDSLSLMHQQRLLFQDYIEHWDHWTLQLEPGAVPMMVIATNDVHGYYYHDDSVKENVNLMDYNQALWLELAQRTAQRHSDVDNQFSHHGNVPFHVLEHGKNDPFGTIIQVENLIRHWIYDHVL